MSPWYALIALRIVLDKLGDLSLKYVLKRRLIM